MSFDPRGDYSGCWKTPILRRCDVLYVRLTPRDLFVWIRTPHL